KTNVFIYLIIIGLACCFCPGSYAAPVGGSNPIIDGNLVAFAFEYDYIFDRDIKSSDISTGEISEQNTFYCKLSFKPVDFLSVYTKTGIANFKLESQLNNGNVYEENYESGFYVGGGASLTYEFVPRVRATIDNQINWWRSDIDSGSYPSSISEISGHSSAMEYQLAGILSYKIDYKSLIHPAHGEWPHLTPYAGVKYTHLKIDVDTTAKSGSTSIPVPDGYKNENKVGIICGADLTFESLTGFSFNVEGRFLDETAISGYLNYNF
ncbi:MAG: hypothetical protein HQ572_05830, partial [Candidatus Omnitrophica bacterium]|nr:hypothetical protein [Candidatus Omnitrophota bacterium]